MAHYTTDFHDAFMSMPKRVLSRQIFWGGGIVFVTFTDMEWDNTWAVRVVTPPLAMGMSYLPILHFYGSQNAFCRTMH